MNYEHSDFDVPADNGIGDENVVNFVQLSDEKDGDEEDDNTEAQLTAESIITLYQILLTENHILLQLKLNMLKMARLILLQNL